MGHGKNGEKWRQEDQFWTGEGEEMESKGSLEDAGEERAGTSWTMGGQELDDSSFWPVTRGMVGCSPRWEL